MAVIDFVFTGDLVLDEPDAEHWLSGIASATRAADVTLGHLEVPHTCFGGEVGGDVPAPGADPGHLAALKLAGFDALSLAGNHIADCGPQGIADTCAELDRLGIAHSGAGPDLAAACAPASWIYGGQRMALLSYNCVGPEHSWAAPQRAGCAYVKVLTCDGRPAAPALPLTVPDDASVIDMQAQIRAARGSHDFIAVALHKGVVHTPVQLAPYERPVAHAAIDAGADVVLGHHAHILRGIEFYRDKPIFHGLGNGCVVTRALSVDSKHPARAEWARRRRKLFGFEPDPAYYLAPFHPEAVNALLGTLSWQPGGSVRVGFIPVEVEPPGRPVIATGKVADAIAAYVQAITSAAGLPQLHFFREADRVMVA